MKLKIALIALLAIVLFSGIASAQRSKRLPDASYYRRDSLTKISYGAKIGVNYNQILGDSTFMKDYTPGFALGGFINSTRKSLGFRGEIMVSSSKYNLLNDSVNKGAYFNIIYADIVALLEVQVIKRVWLQAGPQFSTFISISRDPAVGLAPKNYFSSRNFSAVGGIEIRLPHNFNVGARYLYGFSDIKSDFATVTTQLWTTRTIHAYVGYRFK